MSESHDSQIPWVSDKLNQTSGKPIVVESDLRAEVANLRAMLCHIDDELVDLQANIMPGWCREAIDRIRRELIAPVLR